MDCARHVVTELWTFDACRHRHGESDASQGNDAVASDRHCAAHGGYELDAEATGAVPDWVGAGLAVPDMIVKL